VLVCRTSESDIARGVALPSHRAYLTGRDSRRGASLVPALIWLVVAYSQQPLDEQSARADVIRAAWHGDSVARWRRRRQVAGISRDDNVIFSAWWRGIFAH
jgi:hypothetical protein